MGRSLFALEVLEIPAEHGVGDPLPTPGASDRDPLGEPERRGRRSQSQSGGQDERLTHWLALPRA